MKNILPQKFFEWRRNVDCAVKFSMQTEDANVKLLTDDSSTLHDSQCYNCTTLLPYFLKSVKFIR